MIDLVISHVRSRLSPRPVNVIDVNSDAKRANVGKYNHIGRMGGLVPKRYRYARKRNTGSFAIRPVNYVT